MSTRRNFLKGAGAGLVFCGCGIPMAAHAQSANASMEDKTSLRTRLSGVSMAGI